MDDAHELAATLERLTRAIEATRVAETRADARTAAADATIDDARARIEDAEAQTAHADSHMKAAKAHMSAARAHMGDAEARTSDADRQTQYAMDDADQYQRALYHYQQLVRHRIANPLQIIKGMAHTLLNHTGLGAARRREMIELIEQQAELMERLSLFMPEVEGDAEQGLRPRPFD